MRDLALTILNPSPSGSPIVFSPPAGATSTNVDAQSLISGVVSFALFLVVILTLFFLIWGGIDWIVAQGEKQQIQNARNKVTFAIIGLVVVLSSFLIVGLVGNLFGVKLIIP